MIPKKTKKKSTSFVVNYRYYATQKDSSLATMPPSIPLDFFGDPFTPGAEVKVREDGYMRLEVRDGSVGGKDLYIDMPEERLLQENIKQVDSGYYIDVGTVRKGETYRFYIKSDLPLVSESKLYPKYTYWNNYDRIAELNFEDWTDLCFDDLRIYVQVVEHPKTPKSISIRPSPRKVLPDYDKKVHFDLKRVNKDYSSQDFPKGQTFNVQMDEAKSQYATLHDPKTGQKGTTLQGVTKGFHMDIESHEKIGDFNGSIKLNASTKVLHPVSEEEMEISGTEWLNIVNKKMFLNFSPNPVSKGDTTAVQPYLIYANGIQKQLPSNYPLVYASISNATKSLGTLRDIASGQTGDFLCCMDSGVEFIARSDIPQDTTVARIIVSAYVDKEMPSQKGSVAESEVNTSDYDAMKIDQLDPEENEKLKKQFMEVSSKVTSSTTTSLQEDVSGSVGTLSHNSDKDYLYGKDDLLIVNSKCEEKIKTCSTNDEKAQKLSSDTFEKYSEGDLFSGRSVVNKEKFITNVEGCAYHPPTKKFGYKAQRLGVTFAPPSIPLDRSSGDPFFVPLTNLDIKSCLLKQENKWLFNIENLRIPLFSSYCSKHEFLNLGDGTDTALLAKYITSYEEYLTVLKDINYWKEGPYSQLGESPEKYIFKAGIETHENYHLSKLKSELKGAFDKAFEEIRKLHYDRGKYRCPVDAVKSAKFKIRRILTDAYQSATSKKLNEGQRKQKEIKADNYASAIYEQILQNIQSWANNQPWYN